MKWKLKSGKIKAGNYVGERTVRTRVREKLGPLTAASLPFAEGRCVVCDQAFRPGDYWTIVNRVEAPLWSEPNLKIRTVTNECAHWCCWRKPYRSIDAE